MLRHERRHELERGQTGEEYGDDTSRDQHPASPLTAAELNVEPRIQA
ncbi:MAG: hypothetical protein E7L00_09250 [Propionibacteriaceae bacterium]|nr:hypothetical protein [Propionibacteriaceae bacterium]